MTDGRNQGRVELTWSNKQRRLITVEGGELEYAWVAPSDHRVAEVRLLHEAAQVGSAGSQDPIRGNLLIRGDALHALTSLAGLSDYAPAYVGQVKLAYLDPPFNTGHRFEHYEDGLDRSIWLTMMRDRLRQVLTLLRPDGSIWVHCDDSMQAYLRVLMDEIFGRQNFVATIVWQKRTSRENRKAIGSGHDYIIVYAPMGPQAWRNVRNRIPKGAGTPSNPDNDPRGPWLSIPFSAQGHRPNQMYPITTPTGVVHLPPRGRCWSNIEDRYRELLADNRIYFPRSGSGRPRVKQFQGDVEGLVPMTWWPAAEVGDTEESKKEILDLFPEGEPFDTPKPERLMRRIIEVATNRDEIVLDPFAGSATTAAVAHKLERRWVTIEEKAATIERFALPRLSAVVAGEDLGGITEAVAWEGGDGFTVLDVAPSMFGVEDGVAILADWATGGALAEATTEQLGFVYAPSGPFAGRKGRTRLAVVDGLVNRAVIDILLEHLGEGDNLLVCGTGVDEEAGPYLAERRPGGAVRAIPAALLSSYGRARRWRPTLVERAATAPDPVAAIEVAR